MVGCKNSWKGFRLLGKIEVMMVGVISISIISFTHSKITDSDGVDWILANSGEKYQQSGRGAATIHRD